MNMTDSTRKCVRWRIRLSENELDVVHSAGIKRRSTDALSCLLTTGVNRKPLENDSPILLIDETKIEREIHIVDANCEIYFSRDAQSPPLDNKPPSEDEIIVQQSNDNYSRLATALDGRSIFKLPSTKKTNAWGVLLYTKKRLLVVKFGLRQTILHLRHNAPFGGHTGRRRMNDTIHSTLLQWSSSVRCEKHWKIFSMVRLWSTVTPSSAKRSVIPKKNAT